MRVSPGVAGTAWCDTDHSRSGSGLQLVWVQDPVNNRNRYGGQCFGDRECAACAVLVCRLAVRYRCQCSRFVVALDNNRHWTRPSAVAYSVALANPRPRSRSIDRAMLPPSSYTITAYQSACRYSIRQPCERQSAIASSSVIACAVSGYAPCRLDRTQSAWLLPAR